jgi:hypothetical protein
MALFLAEATSVSPGQNAQARRIYWRRIVAGICRVGSVVARGGSFTIPIDTVANVRFSQSALIILLRVAGTREPRMHLDCVAAPQRGAHLAQAAVGCSTRALGAEQFTVDI